jgi:hypothetical protein
MSKLVWACPRNRKLTLLNQDLWVAEDLLMTLLLGNLSLRATETDRNRAGVPSLGFEPSRKTDLRYGRDTALMLLAVLMVMTGSDTITQTEGKANIRHAVKLPVEITQNAVKLCVQDSQLRVMNWKCRNQHGWALWRQRDAGLPFFCAGGWLRDYMRLSEDLA